jgi:3-deoxy-7-phosphoheptulonate synthase
MQPTQDLNVRAITPLVPPREIKASLPLTPEVQAHVVSARDQVMRVLDGHDQRLMVVVGPCSIHDEKAALDYAERLYRLSGEVADRILPVMRVYFEKPRTTVGWKGLINDPHLNDTFDMDAGYWTARRLLLRITEMGLPTATEFLEPITPQYLADLLTAASIGARTTESPTHRQMASGLSMPVGFKNGTDGSLQVALDAMIAAKSPHSFVGIDYDGKTGVVHTKGNPWGYLILRGGRSGPNYHADLIQTASEQLIMAGLSPRLVVDCSHANSAKDYRRQSDVWNEVLRQRIDGNNAIIGLMLESNLRPGSQKLPKDLSQLQYGVSITDGCIGWEETESLIRDAHLRLGKTPAVKRA